MNKRLMFSAALVMTGELARLSCTVYPEFAVFHSFTDPEHSFSTDSLEV